MSDRELAPRAIDLSALMIGPCSVLTLTDCAYHDVHRLILAPTSIGPTLLPYGSLIFACPISLICLSLAHRVGRTGWYAVALGYVLSFAMVANFRSTFYWSGFFELSDRSKMPLLLFPVIGIAIYLSARRFPWLEKIGRARAIIATTLLGSAYAWIQALTGIDVFSLVPLTRHVALTGLILVTILLVSITLLVWPDIWTDLE